MKIKLTYFFTTVIIILISLNSCKNIQDGHPPASIEERTIANYLLPSGNNSQDNIKFHSINISDIPVSYVAILNNDKNFDHYETMNSNNKQIIIKDFCKKYQNREPKEIIAKLVNCKYVVNDINQLTEQTFILDKTGQKMIYSDDFKKVTEIK